MIIFCTIVDNAATQTGSKPYKMRHCSIFGKWKFSFQLAQVGTQSVAEQASQALIEY